MDKESLRKLLGEIAFSAVLPEKTLDALAKISSVVDVGAGHVIFQEGAVNQQVYLVIDGSVVLEMSVPGRGRVRILTVGDGELLAWSSILGGGRMTATARAVEPTRMVAAPAPELLAVCEADHEVGYALMRRLSHALAQRLVATRLQLLDLFAHEQPQTTASAEEPRS